MRRISVVTCLAVSSVFLAGCGGKPFSEALQEAPAGSVRLLSAVSHVADAKTANFSMNLRIEDMGEQSAETITGSGQLDFRSGRAAMTLRVLAEGRTITAQTRVVDGVTWINTGSGWSADAASSDTGSGGVSTDPTGYLSYLHGLAGAVHESGTETLRGELTTKYTATVSLKRAANAPGETSQDAAKVRKLLDVVGDIDMPVTVWIDSHDRLRKMEFSMDFTNAAKKMGLDVDSEGLHPRVSAVLELRDFGVRVNITTPPQHS